MKCPFCDQLEDNVIDSRTAREGEALKTGDFKSVDFETACGRLKSIATVSLEKPTLDHLNELRKLRNRVQHFAIDVDLEQVRSPAAKGVNFALTFCDDNLEDQIGPPQKLVMEKIHDHLKTFEKFVSERLDQIKDELKQGTELIECPKCWETTLVIGVKEPHCPFCTYKPEPQTLACELSEDGEVKECPKCCAPTCGLIIKANFSLECPNYLCISCGEGDSDNHPYLVCDRCSHLHSGEKNICDSCLSS